MAVALDSATANKDRRPAEETGCARRPAGCFRLTAARCGQWSLLTVRGGGGAVSGAEESVRRRSTISVTCCGQAPLGTGSWLPAPRGPECVEGVVTMAFNGRVL